MIFEYFVFSTVYYWSLSSGVHPYHAAAIFVRFPVRASKIIVLSMHEKKPDYFPIQPRFGNMDLY